MHRDWSYPKKIDDINGYRLFYFNVLYKGLWSNSMNQTFIQLLSQMTHFNNSSYFAEMIIIFLNQLFLSVMHQTHQMLFPQPLS